jgi:hypothetical protein
MLSELRDGVSRPVLPAYSDISLAVQSALHPLPSMDPKNAIQKLRDNLKKARQGKLF